MIHYILIAILVILILGSAFLSATETSFFSLSSMKIRSFKHGKEKRGHLVANLISQPKNLLVTLLMLNIMLNILIQNVVSSIFGSYSGWLVNVGVPLCLTLIFGEVIPKSLALSNNAMMARFAAPTIDRTSKIIAPIRKVLSAVTNVISRAMFFFLKKEQDLSLHELKHALSTSKRSGFLNPEEAKLVRGFLNLEEDHVKEIMTPRQEIIAFNLDDPVEKLKECFVKQECSKLPVYSDSFENILGIIYAGVFFQHEHEIQTSDDIKKLLKKTFYIPESTGTKMLLSQFYERDEEVAIVVDEYGALSGLITSEDLVEVVIGQISDRRDAKVPFTKAGKDIIIASGKLELSQFEDIFDYQLETESNMATVGGFLTEKLGDIPKAGAKYQTSDFLFHILSSDARRIRRVYIRRITPAKKFEEAT